MSSFGYGQRQCLGMSVTQDELLIACGTLAWTFNLKHKIDADTGKDIPIDLTKSNSLLIIKPDPYKMEFEVRSDARRAKVIEDWEAAEKRSLAEKAAFVRAGREIMGIQEELLKSKDMDAVSPLRN